jgi:hypothetical protein
MVVVAVEIVAYIVLCIVVVAERTVLYIVDVVHEDKVPGAVVVTVLDFDLYTEIVVTLCIDLLSIVVVIVVIE